MSLLKIKGLEQSRKVIETKVNQEFVPGSLRTHYFKVHSDFFLNILLLCTSNFPVSPNVEDCTHI